MGGEEHHDVVIIGGGAAGVSCALECFDMQLDVIVLESGPTLGGQVGEIPHSVRNVAAGRFEDGHVLEHALQESAAILGGRARLSHPVTSATLAEHQVEAEGRRFTAEALVVAMGTARAQLAAAVDGTFGGDITYQLESDPQRFIGRDMAVIGGGDSGTLDALALARAGSSVKLIHRSEALSARHDIVEQVRNEPRIEDLAGWELEAAHGNDQLEGISLVRAATGERRAIPVGGLVVKIARVPRTQLFEGQLDLDRSGAIVVDGDLRTPALGVFAAGDIVSGAYWRVAAALGSGLLAARTTLHYLEGRG